MLLDEVALSITRVFFDISLLKEGRVCMCMCAWKGATSMLCKHLFKRTENICFSALLFTLSPIMA